MARWLLPWRATRNCGYKFWRIEKFTITTCDKFNSTCETLLLNVSLNKNVVWITWIQLTLYLSHCLQRLHILPFGTTKFTLLCTLWMYIKKLQCSWSRELRKTFMNAICKFCLRKDNASILCVDFLTLMMCGEHQWLETSAINSVVFMMFKMTLFFFFLSILSCETLK